MNHIYRVTFNAASGVYQAVAKNGKSQGKGSAGKVARSVRRNLRAGGMAVRASMASLFSAAALCKACPQAAL